MKSNYLFAAVQKLVNDWKEKKDRGLKGSDDEQEEENIYAVEDDDEDDIEKHLMDGEQRFVAHVPVPTQQQVEQALLRKRKQELLEKYGVQNENQSL